jgi:hypothetical protein
MASWFPFSADLQPKSAGLISRWLLAILLLFAFQADGPAQGQDGGRANEEQIQGAIKKATVRLNSRLKEMSGGQSALITTALLKAGQSPDNPEIKMGINMILANCRDGAYKSGAHHVYEAGVSIMALANADPVQYKPQIEMIVKFLISVQQSNGGWFYANPAHDTDGDTSITQYAILGLWEAARAGVAVPKKVWDQAAGWHMKYQNPDGSFSYHPVEGAFGFGQGGTHTMTVAGTASLYVARLYLYPDARDIDEVKSKSKKRSPNYKKYGLLEPAAEPIGEEGDRRAAAAAAVADTNYRPTSRLAAIDKSIASGMSWLTKRFTVEPKSGHDIYYLYGIERLMALSNLKEIDGHDWYAEGAALLCRTQDAAGTWNDQCGIEAATALGLMFLGKATSKMLKRPDRRTPEAKYRGGLLVGGRGLPDNLESLEADKQGVHVRKLKGPVDELLAELEKADSQQVESAQSALVEKIATEDPESLVGQTSRLLRLAGDKRIEVRRTVFWALGRTNDLRVVPTLIVGLGDPEPACVIEARNALQFISKKIDAHEPPDEPTPEQRTAAVAFWKKWYLAVRAYDERDDLGELPTK